MRGRVGTSGRSGFQHVQAGPRATGEAEGGSDSRGASCSRVYRGRIAGYRGTHSGRDGTVHTSHSPSLLSPSRLQTRDGTRCSASGTRTKVRRSRACSRATTRPLGQCAFPTLAYSSLYLSLPLSSRLGGLHLAPRPAVRQAVRPAVVQADGQ